MFTDLISFCCVHNRTLHLLISFCIPYFCTYMYNAFIIVNIMFVMCLQSCLYPMQFRYVCFVRRICSDFMFYRSEKKWIKNEINVHSTLHRLWTYHQSLELLFLFTDKTTLYVSMSRFWVKRTTAELPVSIPAMILYLKKCFSKTLTEL